jgi:3-hydroxyacyl-CoA dehydrogenase
MGAESQEIASVAVIGAGVMGAGIAAHFANAGCDVVLLDVAGQGSDPAQPARDAIARQVKAGGFMHPSLAAKVRPGTITDDLELTADADWIIEAIVELPEIKRNLYASLAPRMKTGAILSSNTSTIPLAILADGLPEAIASHFLITHFFNPPRHMRLLEVVDGPGTAAEAVARVTHFADHRLGKSVVPCKDTPGFLANRIGCLWMAAAVRYAADLGLTVEEADAVMSRPFGIPSTGIFALTDLVGVDLMPKVWSSFAETLPAGDDFHTVFAPSAAIDALIARGATGRKAKAGFYRKTADGMEAFDLAALEYRPQAKAELASLAETSARALMEHADRGGRYAWTVMSHSLAYAAALVPAISDDIAPVDEAMRLGYNWRFGPFELIDMVGPGWLADRLAAEGRDVPPLLRLAAERGSFYRDRSALSPAGTMVPLVRPEGEFLLADLKRDGRRVEGNDAASLWDMGDGIACLEFHRKMNAMAPESMDAIVAATRRVAADFRALVIGNDSAQFCAGADLGLFLAALEREDFAFIEDFVRRGQQTYDGLRKAPFPVVGAVAGLALGGGCEVLLHCDHVQAHAETAIGLVERNVGLIPAWGGCRRVLAAAATDPTLPKGPMPFVVAAFDPIAAAAVSASAMLARDLRFLRPTDGITMNRNRLLADAKAAAVRMADAGYQAPVSIELRLPGPSGRHTLMNRVESMTVLGQLRGHDVAVAEVLVDVLTGGPSANPLRPVPEEAILDLEREGFMELVASKPTAQRIAHMLKTGKSLKN